MKKVLSFVLVLALVLSSFSMAFAGQSTEIVTLSDISGSANEEAIQVNYDLGIVTGNPDGTFQPEKAVTRAEFAAMITRALAIPDSALAAYSATSFKDTTGYTWAVPYLAFCNSKGIMLGDGAGNAMPGKTITVNEAVTMALRAVGYTANSAELTGVWPANYVTKAQELKLYDDVAKNATGVDKANAAQIIYNTLTVQKVVVNADGDTTKLWNTYDETNQIYEETTLLTSGLNCELAKDKVIGPEASYDESLINIAKYIGRHGDVYYNDDDEIVAFIPDDAVLVGRFTASDEFTTTVDDKAYNINVDSANYSMTNAVKDTGRTSLSAITGYGTNMASTEFTLSVDLSGKTVKEIYAVSTWKVSAATQVDAADIAEIADDQEFLDFDFALDDDDNIDYTQFDLVGVNSIKDIKADDVVYVYATNDSDKEIVRIEVGTETVEGLVKNYKAAKSDVATTFAIGANTYKNATEVVNNSSIFDGASTITSGDVAETVKAVLDVRGFVYDFESTDSIDNYAVVEKVGSGTIDNQVKVMLADGTEKVMVVEDDDDFNAINAAGTLFGYSLNKDGEISSVDVTKVGTSNKMTTNAGAFVTGASVTLKTNKVATVKLSGGVTSDVAIDSDVVVFTFDGEDYDVTTIDKVDKKGDATDINGAVLFDEGDFTNIVALIVDADHAKSGTKSYAVVNEKNKDANADEDTVWHIVGYVDGKAVDTMTDDDSSSLFNTWAAPDYTSGSGFTSVHVYEVDVDADGIITKTNLITNGYVGSKADTSIVVVSGFDATDADGRDYVVSGTTYYELADNVVIYEVDDDEYKVYKGSLKKGDHVTLYDVDDDEDGYDIVIFARP